MVKKVKASEIEAVVEEEIKSCLHHWVIETAKGPKSEGTCQICGEVKKFSNSIEHKAY